MTVRVFLVALCALVLVPAAAAGPILDRAVSALRRGPVYVDPAAEKSIDEAEAGRLRTEIETKGHGPIYVAVLPAAAVDEAGGSATGVVSELHRRLGAAGVYVVVAGGHFRAGSTDLRSGAAARLATQAFDAHHGEGLGPTLRDFVDRVGSTRAGSGNGGGSGGGLGKIGWFPLIVLGGIVFFVLRAFRRRRAQADAFREVREAARDDLVALADDVQQLEHRVEGNDAAKRDYLAALEQYGRASESFDRARTPEALAPVAEALDEGRYLMASAEARLAGKEPPERRAPCFFDPRHGPSVRDVSWAPPGGEPRDVPACAACALRVEEGAEPASRQVLVGGRSMPYWSAGPLYGGYFGGFFPGLLIGESLGGFGAYGGGWDPGPSTGDFGGDGGGFGDFGGGADFGGGGDGGGGGDF